MFRNLRATFASACAAVLLTAGASQGSTIRIAEFQGRGDLTRFTSAGYTNGIGTLGDAAFIASNLASYDQLGSNVIVRLTMGVNVDYYKPTNGTTLLEMLTSNTKHLWSATETGNYIAPAYYPTHLGGSADSWPVFNVAGDSRRFLSFWGTDTASVGGCCVRSNSFAASWGRAFELDLITPASVPLPAGLPLIASALVILGVTRLRRKRA